MTGTLQADIPVPATPDDTLLLIHAQEALYGELESLARRQRALIAGGDTGPLLALLAERQKLSDKLSKISQGLEPIRRGWDEYRERFTPPQRVAADELLAETRRRLHRVIERDEEDARLLSARKEAATQALRETHATGQAIRAYRVSSGRRACLDRLDGDPS